MMRSKNLILVICIILQSSNNAKDIHSQTDPPVTDEYSVSTPVDSESDNYTYAVYNSTEDYTVSTLTDNVDSYEASNADQDELQVGMGYLSPDDVDVFLLRNETLQFLSTFKPGYQQNVIKTQLKYCPYIKLCGFSFNLQDSFLTCCQSCSCNFPICVKDKTCCPDILFHNGIGFSNDSVTQELPKLEEQNVQTDCIYLYLSKSFMSAKRSAYGYATCPIGTEMELHINCTRAYNPSNISELTETVPVISRETNELYRNMYCAVCNGVSMYHFETLDVELMCKIAPDFSTDTDILNAVLVEENCHMVFSTDHKLNYCYTSVSDCKITGTFEESVCSMYRSVIDIYGQIFQNIFCSICNNIFPTLISCSLGNIEGAQPFAFSGLLKLHKEDSALDIRSNDMPNKDIDKCSEDQIYDKILDLCKDMVCSVITVLKSGKCVAMFSDLKEIIYIVFLRIKPARDLSMADSYIASEQVNAYVQEFLDGMQICGMQMIFKPDISLSENDQGPSVVEHSNLLYFDAKVRFYIYKRHYPNQILAKLMLLHDTNQTIMLNNTSEPVIFKFEIKDDNPENFDEIVARLSQSNDALKYSYEDYDFEPKQTLIIETYPGTCDLMAILGKYDFNIIELTNCPKVEISASDVPWTEEESGITFSNGNYVLKRTEYYFTDKEHIMVCADKYKDYLNQIPQEEMDTSISVESIVSIVCSIVSILALSFTFFVYCLFSKLRGTIPGKNNMSLVFALLLAQTLYITGSFSSLGRNSIECLLFGILIHFSWLVALFWMNICTFHMFRVLTRTKVMSQSSGTKKIIIYHVYALSIAAIFVSINIGVSYAISGDVGYGGGSCYISSQRMILYTFGIPATFVVLSNLCMFTFVIVKIKRSPSVQKNVQNERNDMIVFAKLSTITGATWIFGFLYMWTSSITLSYMFIVLNASQGLFIMFAFIINKRVYDLFRRQVLGVTVTSSDSRRPTFKTSVKTSDKS